MTFLLRLERWNTPIQNNGFISAGLRMPAKEINIRLIEAPNCLSRQSALEPTEKKN
jgi:tRNA A37 threonylcarbamoyladenosine synthetase subunit TsaC/SUA5/YrdC